MTETSSPERKHLSAAVVLVVLLVVGTALVFALPRQTDEQISLDVACASSADVVGVWIEAANGGSGFAERSADGAPFVFTLSFGGPYYVNVGCGGTRQKWAVETRSAEGDRPHRILRCEDRPDAERICRDEPHA